MTPLNPLAAGPLLSPLERPKVLLFNREKSAVEGTYLQKKKVTVHIFLAYADECTHVSSGEHLEQLRLRAGFWRDP